jgi:hypothetical protein
MTEVSDVQEGTLPMSNAGSAHSWVKKLALGLALLGAAFVLHSSHVGPAWLVPLFEAVGGLSVVFASCELMILCVEGVAKRLGWNDFVAGSIAGLASNVPEVVMLGFIIAAAPRMGFIVVALTLHTGALAFGIYSGLLPRDDRGLATMPKALVKLSTDLFAGAAGAFLATGVLMLTLFEFAPDHATATLALTPRDLYVLGGLLLLVQVVATRSLVKLFAGGAAAAADPGSAPSVPTILAYGVGGTLASLVGGHAVGSFSDTLVEFLRGRGYSEMFGALLLSIFACSGAIAMIATAHAKKLHEVALANVSGWITQMAFVVMPVALIILGVFSQLGVTPPLEGGGALPIDSSTTSVFLLGFPPLLLLWKAVQDDGSVSWVETATMVCVFGLSVYSLALR